MGEKHIPADALSRIPWSYGESPWSRVDTGGEVAVPVVTEGDPVMNWTAEQDADEDVGQLKRWLQRGERPAKEVVRPGSLALRSYWATFEQFELKDGIVCHVWTDEGGLPDRHLKVVPTTWRNTILQGHHEERGHIGQTKMKILLRNSFYWYGMAADINQWVNACKVC